MSGPKISAVELEARRRKQIAEERQRNESMLKGAIYTIRAEIGDARRKTATMGPYQAEALQWLENAEHRFVVLATEFSTDGYPDDPVSALYFNNHLQTKLADNLNALLRELADKSEEWESDVEAVQALSELESLSRSLESSAPEQSIAIGAEMVARLLAASAPATADAPEEETESESQDVMAEVLESAGACLSTMQALVLDEAVSVASKRMLMQMAQSINKALAALSEDSSQLVALRETVEAASAEIIPIRRRARDKRSAYDLCACEAARIASLTGSPYPIPSLGQLSSLEEVQEQYAELRALSTKASEEAYIAHAIDQVMERHGYNVKKSVRLAATDDRMHDLYLDSESDAGIRCFRGSNGLVMLETGSVDDSVRSCEDGEVVERYHPESLLERARLQVRQEEFCDLFPQIVEELAELGVIVHKRRHLPPSEEYSFAFATADARTSGADCQSDASRTRITKKKTTLREREAH